MFRYLVYLANRSWEPKDARMILIAAAKVLPSGVIVRDARVSSSFVELDCSIPDDFALEELLSRLGSVAPAIESEQVVERQMNDRDAMLRARDMFNKGRYWSSHEALEQVWKKSSGKEKELLNGFILVAAALVHDQKGENEICLSIMKRAQLKLRDAGGRYHDIDIDRLKMKIANILSSGNVERLLI